MIHDRPLGCGNSNSYATGVDTLINFFVGVHVLGIAVLLGGFFYQLKAASAGEARILPGMLHGALTMLVTGLALAGLNEADDVSLNNTKLGVKTAVLLVILVLVYAKRKDEKVSAAVFWAIGGLTAVNVFLAVLWT